MNEILNKNLNEKIYDVICHMTNKLNHGLIYNVCDVLICDGEINVFNYINYVLNDGIVGVCDETFFKNNYRDIFECYNKTHEIPLNELNEHNFVQFAFKNVCEKLLNIDELFTCFLIEMYGNANISQTEKITIEKTCHYLHKYKHCENGEREFLIDYTKYLHVLEKSTNVDAVHKILKQIDDKFIESLI